MKPLPTSLLLSCFYIPSAYAQTALDPAFINYLLEFGEQPELFDAAHQELDKQPQDIPATTKVTKDSKHANNNTKEIKQ